MQRIICSRVFGVSAATTGIKHSYTTPAENTVWKRPTYYELSSIVVVNSSSTVVFDIELVVGANTIKLATGLINDLYFARPNSVASNVVMQTLPLLPSDTIQVRVTTAVAAATIDIIFGIKEYCPIV